MDSLYKSKIKLILSNDTWVPKKQKLLSALDQRGEFTFFGGFLLMF